MHCIAQFPSPTVIANPSGNTDGVCIPSAIQLITRNKVQNLLIQSHSEIPADIPQIVIRNHLPGRLSPGGCQRYGSNLRSLLNGMHQPKRRIKIRAGYKQSVERPDSRVKLLHQHAGSLRNFRTAVACIPPPLPLSCGKSGFRRSSHASPVSHRHGTYEYNLPLPLRQIYYSLVLPSSAAGGKPIFVMHSALNASSYISPFLIKSNFRPDSFL